MKNYSILSPFWTLKDENKLKKDTIDVPVILEKYSNDIYKLFLRKLSGFETRPYNSLDEIEEIRHLFDEFVKIKTILAEDYKKDIL